ncbi:hypothetical protein KKA15_06815 [Patescibacteria group bacterium]|nr:hypothetical protein [Patescibacteria group bacterium]
MKINNFVIFPRIIKSDYLEGKITRDEYFVYSWLRLSANPYGICTIGLSDLKNDLFRGRGSVNYVNKILLSIKRKRYIYYGNRKGRRGTFEVNIGDFLLASGKISNLDRLFKQEKVRSSDTTTPITKSEVIPEVKSASQRLDEQKKQLNKGDYATDDDKQVRGDNNDNDNKNYIDSIDRSNFNNSSNGNNNENYTIPLDSFCPDSKEEERCRFVARELGETDMRFILSCLKKYGINIIERAYGRVKETPDVDNQRKYFNKVVKNLGEEKNK